MGDKALKTFFATNMVLHFAISEKMFFLYLKIGAIFAFLYF